MADNILEHHAYLSFDELEGCAQLFEKPITKITVDLRGRTSVSKNKSKLSELGIKKLAHSYLDVIKDDLEINNIQELKSIIAKYNAEGVSNLYIIKLVVQWNNGDMQEWKRHIIHGLDDVIARNVASGRLNTLTMKVGTFQGVDKLRDIYGDLVKPTLCENQETTAHIKRF